MSDEHEHPAVRKLNEVGREWPGAWDAYDGARANRAEHPNGGWPAYCFCPPGPAIHLVRSREGSVEDHRGYCAMISTMAAWRATKGIYRIHETLLAALMKTPLDGVIPVAILRQLPEWCIYVEIGGEVLEGVSCEGFWAHIVSDGMGTEDIWIEVMLSNGAMVMAGVPMLLGTLDDGLNSIDQNGHANAKIPKSVWRALIAPLLSVIVYLCSVSAEHRDASGSDRQPANARPLPDKRGKLRIRPPNKPTIWATGTRMGAALDAAYAKQRAAESDGTGRHVIGHIRRAHWHAFWTGPMDGERALRVKWLPPIAVNLDDVPEVATVRPVRGATSK